jgi:hypothetical protein
MRQRFMAVGPRAIRIIPPYREAAIIGFNG